MYAPIIIDFFEIVAAIAGTFYISKYREDKFSRYLVVFLWCTVILELTFGLLPMAIFHLASFSYLKGTVLENNIWVYNLYDIISFVFYFLLFSSLDALKKIQKVSFIASAFFVVFAIFNLCISKTFFTEAASINFVLGSILLLFHIIYYFFQILQSDQILDFYKVIFFYIGIGALVFHLILPPILIYSKFFSNARSPDFVQIYEIILRTANIFMYTCYTIGFIVCLRKNQSY